MASNLVNLAQDGAFTEEVWLLGVNDNVVKVGGPVAARATLQTSLHSASYVS